MRSLVNKKASCKHYKSHCYKKWKTTTIYWQRLTESTFSELRNLTQDLDQLEDCLMKKRAADFWCFKGSLAGHWLTIEITKQRLQWPHLTKNTVFAKIVSKNSWKSHKKINSGKPWDGGRIRFPVTTSCSDVQFSRKSYKHIQKQESVTCS